MQAQDKGKVQDNVEDAGEGEEEKRQQRVADRPQDAAAHVVDEQSRDPHEVDVQVGDGFGKDVRRRGHQAQHRADHADPDPGKEDADHEGRGHGGLYGRVQAVHLSGTEIVADDHAGADGEPVEEKDEHVDDHRGGAHGGQCLGADKIADDDDINGIVEHLKDVAHHQGQ